MKSQNTLYDNLLKETILSNKKNFSLSTGIKTIDNSGFKMEPGKLIFLGSLNPFWNSQFLINTAINIGKNDALVYYSYYQSELGLAENFTKILLEKPYFDVIGNIDKNLLIERSNSLKIKVNCNKLNTVNDIYFDVISDIHSRDVKLIIIEGFELIFSNKETKLNQMCKKLAKYAIAENVCIIVSTCLPYKFVENKKDKRPQINVLEKIKLKRTLFDKIIFLHNPEYFGADRTEKIPFPNFVDFTEENRNGYCSAPIKIYQDKNYNILNDVEVN